MALLGAKIGRSGMNPIDSSVLEMFTFTHGRQQNPPRPYETDLEPFGHEA
jgi:hypothetical protein